MTSYQNICIKNLHQSFTECLLDDDNDPTEIYNCLMNVITEEESYFKQQLERVQKIKKLLANNNSF